MAKPFTSFQLPGTKELLDLLDVIERALGMAERSNALASQLLDDGGTMTPDQARVHREALTGYQAAMQQMRATLTALRRDLLNGET